MCCFSKDAGDWPLCVILVFSLAGIRMLNADILILAMYILFHSFLHVVSCWFIGYL